MCISKLTLENRPDCDYFRTKQLKKYGLTPETYKELLIQQDYRCAICGKHRKEMTKDIHIDHCHATNKVRGLLCHSCNVLIGMAKDNLYILTKAKQYLKDSGTDKIAVY